MFQAVKRDCHGNIIKFITLTQRAYYDRAKINAITFSNTKLSKRNKRAFNAMSKYTLKTASSSIFIEHLKNRAVWFPILEHDYLRNKSCSPTDCQ